MSIILGVDTHSRAAGVCLMQGGNVLFEKQLLPGATHSETLMALIEQALQTCGVLPQQISAYALCAGPGSFTGLRIGMALVKGLALPYGTKVAAVSTLQALAYAAQAKNIIGTVVPALDARRSEVYWAAFCTKNGVRRLTEDSAGPAKNVQEQATFFEMPLFFVGDGAEICYNTFTHCLKAPQQCGNTYLNAAVGAALVAHQNMGILQDARDVRPQYIRLSQAERERMAKTETQPNN